MVICVNICLVFHNSWILAVLYMADIKKKTPHSFLPQKLFLDAKDTDEMLNKKEEGNLLESEVRKIN